MVCALVTEAADGAHHILLLKSHNSIPYHSGALEIQCPVGREVSVGVSVVNRTLEFGGKLFQKGDP